MSDVRGELMTIFLVGFESTSLTLCWTLYCLGRYPAVKAKLLAEFGVLGGGDIDEEAIAQLPYMTRLFKEVCSLLLN